MTQALPRGSRTLAWTTSIAAVAYAIVLALYVASQGDPLEPQPPQLVSRGAASTILIATPGLIGAIGAATGRGTVLVAAGVLCLMQSVVAFSGVTLVYLIPAVGFLHAASGGPVTRSEGFGTRGLLLVVVLLFLGLLIAFTLGIFGVLALVAVVVATSVATGCSRPMPGREAIRGVAIVALVIGAWAASFTFVETACWVGREAPEGGIAWDRIPPANTMTLGPGDLISTCGGDEITPAGAAVGGGLIATAIVASALPGGRKRAADHSGRSPGAPPA